MEINVIVIGALFLLAWACNGMMDRIQFHWDTAPQWMKKLDWFFNPEKSWIRKWKVDSKSKPVYKDGKLVPRFFLSDTLLVSFTDGWHLLKWIMTESICIALAIATGVWWYYFIFRTIVIIGFRLTYR